jgi:RNA polymerase sigma-70 factor (ECF subfamily)
VQDIEKIYNEHFQMVFKYVFCMTSDSDLSEELTQETFYQAIRTYDNFRGDAKVSTWLCQIAKNLWLKEYKRRKQHDTLPIDALSDEIPCRENIEQEIWDGQSKLDLYKRIQNLDEKMREVMYLRLTGELSFREIGEILKKNETWARVTFYRGKQRMVKEEWE